eukprot:Hpha_TRINITY_DN15297_c3_g2::TRINITY_DN15297_c3_g2_i3::g.65652::m.65652
MKEINRGTSGDCSYIPLQEVHDRIVQQIKVAKQWGLLDNNPRFREFLYKAADMADVDLRIFNGRQKGRVSGSAPAAGVDSTVDFVGGAEGQLANPRTSDVRQRQEQQRFSINPNLDFNTKKLFEGKDEDGEWSPIVIRNMALGIVVLGLIWLGLAWLCIWLGAAWLGLVWLGLADPQFAVVWTRMGNAGGWNIRGRAYSQTECYERALSIDPQFAVAWNQMGNAGGGNIGGRAYSQTECYEKALSIDPQIAAAWTGLGNAGGGN